MGFEILYGGNGFKVFKGRHFQDELILLCVRWYLAYGLSLRDLEEMMAERGVSVDHSTIHRWVVRYTPQLLDAFNARKRPVTGKWHVEETYIKVRGGMDVSLPGDRQGWGHGRLPLLEDLQSQGREAFFRRAYAHHGPPVQVTIDGRLTNLEAARKCHAEVRMRARSKVEPLKVRQSQYMNNRIEQDHRRIKRRIRPMLGFKSERTAAIILGGIELVHMIRKGQMASPDARSPSLAEQFNRLAA